MKDEYTLHEGKHDSFDQGHCLMEVVAHLAGEEHSDAPQCACPVLSAFGRRFNDLFKDDESRTRCLAKAASLLVNSKDEGQEAKRAFLLADLAARRWAPVGLEKGGRKDEAQKLRELSPIVDRDSAKAAYAASAYAASAYAAFAYAASYAASYAPGAADAADAGCIEDAAACFVAILKGEDPWAIPIPRG